MIKNLLINLAARAIIIAVEIVGLLLLSLFISRDIMYVISIVLVICTLQAFIQQPIYDALLGDDEDE